MGRASVLRRAADRGASRSAALRALWGIVLLLASPAVGSIEASSPIASPFPLRIVKAGGPPGDPAVLDHLEFSAEAGFNAVWVRGEHAGSWSSDPPVLNEAFLSLVDECHGRGLRIVVALDPFDGPEGPRALSDAKTNRRLRKFLRLLRRRAGVNEFVLSFNGRPTELTDLREVLRHGRSTAPLHLKICRRLTTALRARDRLWLFPAVSCDAQRSGPAAAYFEALASGLSDLPRRVGIVWTGPEPASRTVTSAHLAEVRALLGGRPLLLHDGYPANGNDSRDALALVIGPLRQRDPLLPDTLAGYVACPMRELGASRLSLLTVADYLADPTGYDPAHSWLRAMERLAGEDGAALRALKTQALEWGGWIGTRNYLPRDRDNVATAVSALTDPAARALWGWTERRYPLRMADLEGVADRRFREELLERMAARLAVARALPLVVEYRARIAAGRTDLESVLAELRRVRELTRRTEARRLLELFLEASGVTLESRPRGEAPRGPGRPQGH